jgi:hypothetical protein
MQSSSDTIALPGFELDLAQQHLRDAAGAEVRLRPQAMRSGQALLETISHDKPKWRHGVARSPKRNLPIQMIRTP